MRSLIIPDIHDKISIVDQIVLHEQPDEVIFLGDAFDSFDDTPKTAEVTARWLKTRLHTPGYHFILGNHETQYRWPKSPWLVTGAYSANKQKVIDQILTEADWKKTHFALQRGKWWLSHSGFHPDLFLHPILGWDKTRVLELLQEAKVKTQAGIHTPITDEKRKPDGPPSGIQWLRWEDFTPIYNVCQIVGHTAHLHPQENNTELSRNINLDTYMRFYAILENDEIKLVKNKFAPKLEDAIYRGLKAKTPNPEPNYPD